MIRWILVNPATAQLSMVGVDTISVFKELVRRALNTWPDAPAEMKTFGDMVCEGTVLQNYADQNQPMKKYTEFLPPRLTDVVLPTCPKCFGSGYHHMHNCPTLLKDNTV